MYHVPQEKALRRGGDAYIFLGFARPQFRIDLDIFPERARLAPPWPLTSSHLNTASVYYLLDLSSFSLLSAFFCTTVFSFFYVFIDFSSFVQFLRTQGQQ